MKLFQLCVSVVIFAGAVNGFSNQPAGKKDNFFAAQLGLVYETDKGGKKSADLARVYRMIEETGLGAFRTPIRSTQFRNELGKFTEKGFDRYDRLLKAIPEDVRIIAYIDDIVPADNHLMAKNPEAFKKAYIDYISKLVTHYKGRIKCWEVWNEENNNHFWKNMPGRNGWSAADFMKYILKDAYKAIKKIDPNSIVICGGTVYNGVLGHRHKKPLRAKIWGDPSTYKGFYVAPDFYEHLYEAMNPDGVKRGERPVTYFDVLAIHPYYRKINYDYTCPKTGDYDPVDQTYGKYGTAKVMNKFGDYATPIWWTELGEPINNSRLGCTLESQAVSVTKHLTNGLKQRSRKNNPLGCFVWYMFRDQWLENNKVKFGLITRDNFRTPSFYAYQKIIMDNNAFCSLIDGFNHAGTGYNKNIWTLKGKAAADKNDTLTLMQDSVLQTYRFAPMPKDKILYQDIIINIPVRKTASPVTVTLGGKLPEQQLKIMFSGKNSVVMKCGQQELFHDRLPINRGDIEIKLQLSRKSITGSIFTNNEKDSVAFDLKTDILNGVKACGASISAGSGTVILKDFVLTDKVLPKAADFGKF